MEGPGMYIFDWGKRKQTVERCINSAGENLRNRTQQSKKKKHQVGYTNKKNSIRNKRLGKPTGLSRIWVVGGGFNKGEKKGESWEGGKGWVGEKK